MMGLREYLWLRSAQNWTIYFIDDENRIRATFSRGRNTELVEYLSWNSQKVRLSEGPIRLLLDDVLKEVSYSRPRLSSNYWKNTRFFLSENEEACYLPTPAVPGSLLESDHPTEANVEPISQSVRQSMLIMASERSVFAYHIEGNRRTIIWRTGAPNIYFLNPEHMRNFDSIARGDPEVARLRKVVVANLPNIDPEEVVGIGFRVENKVFFYPTRPRHVEVLGEVVGNDPILALRTNSGLILNTMNPPWLTSLLQTLEKFP